jgi:hypothetical protein
LPEKNKIFGADALISSANLKEANAKKEVKKNI